MDGLCEAEQHCPDHGPTLDSFLATNVHTFPLVVTLRTSLPFVLSLKYNLCLCPSLDSEASEDCDEDISEMVALLLEWGVGVDTGTPGTCGTTDHWPVWGL